jgi:hypothetical protein
VCCIEAVPEIVWPPAVDEGKSGVTFLSTEYIPASPTVHVRAYCQRQDAFVLVESEAPARPLLPVIVLEKLAAMFEWGFCQLKLPVTEGDHPLAEAEGYCSASKY